MEASFKTESRAVGHEKESGTGLIRVLIRVECGYLRPETTWLYNSVLPGKRDIISGDAGTGSDRINADNNLGGTMTQELVGTVTHYFGKIQVAAIKLEAPLKKGDHIHIEGHSSDFTQTVESMQLDQQDIEVGQKGQEIAIKVKEQARTNDKVYRVTD